MGPKRWRNAAWTWGVSATLHPACCHRRPEDGELDRWKAAAKWFLYLNRSNKSGKAVQTGGGVDAQKGWLSTVWKSCCLHKLGTDFNEIVRKWWKWAKEQMLGGGNHPPSSPHRSPVLLHSLKTMFNLVKYWRWNQDASPWMILSESWILSGESSSGRVKRR